MTREQGAEDTLSNLGFATTAHVVDLVDNLGNFFIKFFFFTKETRSRHPEAPGSFERVQKTDPSNCEFKLESGKSCDGAKLIFIAHQPT